MTTNQMITEVQTAHDEMYEPKRKNNTEIEITLWGVRRTLQEWAEGLSKALDTEVPRSRLKMRLHYYRSVKGIPLPDALEAAMKAVQRIEKDKKSRTKKNTHD